MLWYDLSAPPKKTSAKPPKRFFIGLTADGRAWKIFESGPPEGPFVSLEALLLSNSLKKTSLSPAYEESPFPKVPCADIAVEGRGQPCASKLPEMDPGRPPEPWGPKPESRRNTALGVGVGLLCLGSGALVVGAVGFGDEGNSFGENFIYFTTMMVGGSFDLLAVIPLTIHAVKQRRAKP